MCTKICFLGCAPGLRVPVQSPTIGGGSAAKVAAGTILNPRITANPQQSPNEDARRGFIAVSFSGVTVFSPKLYFLPLLWAFIAAFRVTRVFFRALVVFVLPPALIRRRDSILGCLAVRRCAGCNAWMRAASSSVRS